MKIHRTDSKHRSIHGYASKVKIYTPEELEAFAESRDLEVSDPPLDWRLEEGYRQVMDNPRS